MGELAKGKFTEHQKKNSNRKRCFLQRSLIQRALGENNKNRNEKDW